MDASTAKETLTIEEVGEVLGIGRNLAYALAREGHLPVLRLGRKRLVVPKRALDEMLNGVRPPRELERLPR
jgi:excisionase family DNA binding protein